MFDLISSLQFFIFPLLVLVILAILLAFIGVFITLRKDILSAIAYPNFSYGIISLLILIGIPIEDKSKLFLFTAIIVILFSFISFKNTKRMLYWTVLFSFGTALSLFSASFSWQNQSYLKNIFQTEIMVINQQDFIKVIFFVFISIVIFLFSKALLFNLVIYPENLFVKNKKKYYLAQLIYQILSLCMIIISSLFIGPFLTISFLIVPIFFSTIAKSFFSFLCSVIAINLFSILIGFSIAIFLDISPTSLIVISNLTIGAIFLLLKKIFLKFS